MRLLSKSELAGQLGVPNSYVSGMVRWGCPFPGGKVFVEDAIAWLRANPDFRPYKAPPQPPVTAAKAADKSAG